MICILNEKEKYNEKERFYIYNQNLFIYILFSVS